MTADDPRRYTPHCRCGTHWTGSNTCHCAACHRTFTSPAAFTRHRRDTWEGPETD